MRNNIFCYMYCQIPLWEAGRASSLATQPAGRVSDPRGSCRGSVAIIRLEEGLRE